MEKLKVYLGDFVETKRHEHQGRIYGKHSSFEDTGEGNHWFDIQSPKLKTSTKDEVWVDILTKDGGAILVPISDITKIVKPYNLNNIWESEYFRTGESNEKI